MTAGPTNTPSGTGSIPPPHSLERRPDGIWRGVFFAMASRCELLVENEEESVAQDAFARVVSETMRIERKFSRYREDSIVAEIHRGRGREVTLDEETAGLLSFAEQAFELSDGAFDITSGILRRVWSFTPGSAPPSRPEVDALLSQIGWRRVIWTPPTLVLPEGMEIDLGGIGKEYAVDRAVDLLRDVPGSFLVNLGGDLRVLTTIPGSPRRWTVGIESPDQVEVSALELGLETGALATSGDSKRSVVRDGVRYGHVFDPRTGWPVPSAPRAVTVHAPTCIEAGMLATLALLQGSRAETFLEEQAVPHWCYREAKPG